MNEYFINNYEIILYYYQVYLYQKLEICNSFSISFCYFLTYLFTASINFTYY